MRVLAPAGWALVLVALLALAGCQAEEGTPPTSSGGTASATWADAAATFSSEACTGCHGSNVPNLTVCATLVNGFHITASAPTKSIVYLVAAGTLASPTGTTDMKCDVAANLTTLAAWINGGATCN